MKKQSVEHQQLVEHKESNIWLMITALAMIINTVATVMTPVLQWLLLNKK